MDRGGAELHSVDDAGTKSDAHLHEPILDAGDHRRALHSWLSAGDHGMNDGTLLSLYGPHAVPHLDVKPVDHDPFAADESAWRTFNDPAATHGPPDPRIEAARRVIDPVAAFAQGGLHGVAKQQGLETPAWSDALAAGLQHPDLNAALGVVTGMPPGAAMTAKGVSLASHQLPDAVLSALTLMHRVHGPEAARETFFSLPVSTQHRMLSARAGSAEAREAQTRHLADAFERARADSNYAGQWNEVQRRAIDMPNRVQQELTDAMAQRSAERRSQTDWPETLQVGGRNYPMRYNFERHPDQTGGWINGTVKVGDEEIPVGGGWVDKHGKVEPYGFGDIGEFNRLLDATGADRLALVDALRRNVPDRWEQPPVRRQWPANLPEPGPVERGNPTGFNAPAPATSEAHKRLLKEYLGLEPDQFKGRVRHYDDGGFHLEGELRDPARNEPIGWIEREVNPGERSAEHKSLSLRPQFRNQGIGNDIIRHNMDWYRANGVDNVNVLAASQDGGYHWARTGFVPTKEGFAGWDAVRKRVGNDLESLHATYGLGDEGYQAAKSILADPDPRAIWRLADLQHPVGTGSYSGGQARPPVPLGKRLLSGERWDGTFDVTDPDTMDRFDAYHANVKAKGKKP
jgi:GNAT superfamily N-acetyltransferase